MAPEFLRKPITGLLLLAGAAGGPYLLFETEAGKQARSTAQGVFGSGESGTAAQVHPGWLTSTTAGPPASENLLNPNPTSHNLSQPAIHTLKEVLRFDIDPNWVMARFPRVSTVLADMQLDGLRVPLVTGTQPSDLAGTLTYYFDRYKRLQRVQVHGVCGDPNRFVAEFQQMFHMEQQPSLGGGFYVLKWNGRPTSLLQITPAPVIYADSQYSRYNVFVELNQPGMTYGLSPAATQLIEAGKQTHRWQ